MCQCFTAEYIWVTSLQASGESPVSLSYLCRRKLITGLHSVLGSELVHFHGKYLTHGTTSLTQIFSKMLIPNGNK